MSLAGMITPSAKVHQSDNADVAFDNYFKYIHASWLSPIIAIALAFGVLAGVLTWVAGPSKGIFAVGKAGYMPPFFQKTNKLGVQKNILFVQGGAVTVLSLLFVVMPSVQSFYQILSQLTVVLYLIMYMLMFTGAIVLRYKMKKLNRPVPYRYTMLSEHVSGCGSFLARRSNAFGHDIVMGKLVYSITKTGPMAAAPFHLFGGLRSLEAPLEEYARGKQPHCSPD